MINYHEIQYFHTVSPQSIQDPLREHVPNQEAHAKNTINYDILKLNRHSENLRK